MHLDTWIIDGRGFHFGRRGLGQEECSPAMPSDSLFAALLDRLARAAGPAAVEDFIQPFLNGSPPFVLSSTFPYAGAVRFLPLPAGRRGEPAGGVLPKQLKKVAFVSERLLADLLAGRTLAEIYPQALKLQGGALLAAPGDVPALPHKGGEQALDRLWVVEKRPRVTLGRGQQNSNLFFTGRVEYAPACGLWLGVRWLVEDARRRALLAELFADLSEAGLGAERSIGFGACEIYPGPALELPDAGDGPWVTFSRYLPAADEIHALQHPAAAYAVETVGGWLGSPVREGQRRRPVNLLVEGSVLGPLARPVPGRLVDVRPRYATGDSNRGDDPLGHPVYRCGLALAVGLPAAAGKGGSS